MPQDSPQPAADAASKPARSEYAGAAAPSLTERMDDAMRLGVASLTSGMSPVSLAAAGLDWAMHLAMSPGKQLKLLGSGLKKTVKLADYTLRSIGSGEAQAPAVPDPRDRRFSDEGWQKFPFNVMSQSFLLAREWAGEATTGIDGVTRDHEAMMGFLAHQVLDAVSPYTIPVLNPEVLSRTRAESGGNLVRGIRHLGDDFKRQASGELSAGTDQYELGKDLACTPGKVIYRNRLMELIQYTPSTDKVVAEPLLIVPPWIMKYYILDLSPANSMIKYLVDQGHTVFTISWKNPDAGDRDLGLNDYLQLGFMEAMDVVGEVVPGRKVNAVGYCAGGTLLFIGAATLAREGDQRLNTVTTFTAQTDCTEPGEIKLFLNDAQLTLLKEMMRRDGFLDGKYFASAFAAMNANDLIWKPLIDRYLLGEEERLIDLMAWNKDLTRVPYRLHYDWLKKIYLENQLAEDHYQVGGASIHLSDIRLPMCAVATTTDHVAPWKSVYKIHRLAPNSDLTFMLTNGGHNAGIACGPEHPRRYHHMATRKPGAGYVQPDRWAAQTPRTPGSWWPSWNSWLLEHSGDKVKPPAMGGGKKKFPALCEAPGTYIHMR